jgi:hypothetical protein
MCSLGAETRGAHCSLPTGRVRAKNSWRNAPPGVGARRHERVGKYFSKVLNVVALYSKHTRVLTLHKQLQLKTHPAPHHIQCPCIFTIQSHSIVALQSKFTKALTVFRQHLTGRVRVRRRMELRLSAVPSRGWATRRLPQSRTFSVAGCYCLVMLLGCIRLILLITNITDYLLLLLGNIAD